MLCSVCLIDPLSGETLGRIGPFEVEFARDVCGFFNERAAEDPDDYRVAVISEKTESASPASY